MTCEFCNSEEDLTVVILANLPRVACRSCAIIHETALTELRAMHNAQEARWMRNPLYRLFKAMHLDVFERVTSAITCWRYGVSVPREFRREMKRNVV